MYSGSEDYHLSPTDVSNVEHNFKKKLMKIFFLFLESSGVRKSILLLRHDDLHSGVGLANTGCNEVEPKLHDQYY